MKKINSSQKSSSQKKNLRIAVISGDPAGIGPEVSLKALQDLKQQSITPVVVGTYSYFQKYYPAHMQGYSLISLDSNFENLETGEKYFANVDVPVENISPGYGSVQSGNASRSYIDAGVKLWLEGKVDALVTGPVNKGFIEKTGIPFTGHTEYISELIKETTPFMMMYSSKYRVLLATTHMPVSKICNGIDMSRLLSVIRMGYESMQLIDGDDVKIAVAGLDPHCGDEGAIGDFDQFVTQPAIAEARNEGIDVYGPFSADTLFIGDRWQKYNLVIAHYHDQGLIPFKLLSFGNGVNVTLGLSITRTSVDHGTAYDIAGTDSAQYSSMREAIELAYRLESGKRDRHNV